MKEFNISCLKGQGQALGFFLRKMSYAYCPSWRPIAYNVNNIQNVLYGDNVIVPDMVTFMKKLTDLQFQVESNYEDEFLIETYSANGSFSSEDFNVGSHSIKCVSPSIQLLASVENAPIQITIIYRKSFGVHTSEDNLNFLLSKKVTQFSDGFKTMLSNHSEVQAFVFDVEETGFDTENLNIKISCKNNDEQAVLKESINCALETLAKATI